MLAFDRALELTRPAGRRREGHFLAEGPHLVDEALRAGAEMPVLFVSFEAGGDAETADLVRRAVDRGTRIERISARQMTRLADTDTPQGVIAVVRMPETPAEPFAAPGLWLLLDGIQDPGNAGTLLRSADAFGVRGAVAGPGTADLWSGKTLRAAQGAHFRLTLVQAAGGTDAALDAFAAAGGVVWAAAKDGASVYASRDVPPRTMLALGSEAHGLGDAVLARAARRVAVPQPGRAESLNVAMAGSILLSWLAECTRPPDGRHD